MEAWLPDAIPGTTLYLIFLAAHTNGLHYLQNKFNPEAEKKHISLIYKQQYLLNNRTYNKDKYDCLWARQITNDELVDRFISRVQERCQGKDFTPRIFRPDGTPQQETLFSSPDARDIVERAFLKAGAYIVSLPKEPKFEMRPMGYEYLESLGFGAMFITYRNIANNCPLALWWGDTSYPSSHPFSKWYPLFPRKVNEPSRNFGNLDIPDF